MSSSRALESLPVGFRFRPTDEELIDHYLRLKKLGEDSQVDHVIAEVDICKREPWELPDMSEVKFEDSEWFFFCPRNYKYSNSNRKDRATRTGYWKVTGRERQIRARATKAIIGNKRTLVFHKGRNTAAEKTQWVIHEYNSAKTLPNERAFVLCRLFKKTGDLPECDNQAVRETVPEVLFPSEPSVEPTFLQPSQAQNHYYPTLQSPACGEQEMNFPFVNGFRNDDNGLLVQSFFEAGEAEEDLTDFVNSILVDPDEYSREERVQTLLHGASAPKSINVIQFADGGVGSDTDTDVAYGRPSPKSVSFSEEAVGAKEYRRVSMVKIPRGTSELEQSRKHKNVSLNDQFALEGTSSLGFTSDVFLSQKLSVSERQESSVDVTTRTGVTTRRIQVRRPTTAVSVDKAPQNSAVDVLRNGKSSAETKNDRKTVRDESSSCEFSGRNWKSFFIFEEAPISRIPSPPSVYFFNAFMGMILFAAFVRELVLYGCWC